MVCVKDGYKGVCVCVDKVMCDKGGDKDGSVTKLCVKESV